MVIFNAPHQIGGENSYATHPGKPEGSHFIVTNCDSMSSSWRGKASHATDSGKPEGSHFIVAKNRDSMLTADRVSKSGKEGGKAGFIKPKGGSTEWYVTAKVNPIDITHLSEKRAWFAKKTKQKLQLNWSPRAPCPHFHLAHMLT